jgi:hypothetical protein
MLPSSIAFDFWGDKEFIQLEGGSISREFLVIVQNDGKLDGIVTVVGFPDIGLQGFPVTSHSRCPAVLYPTFNRCKSVMKMPVMAN